MNIQGVFGIEVKRSIDQARDLLQTSNPILLIGKRGCGKDFIAKYLHAKLLSRNENMFQVIDCSKPRQLLKEELFGSKNYDDSNIWDGTEAINWGKIDLAAQGSIILNNIHNSSEENVDLLIDVITQKPFYPVNSRDIRYFENVQIIATCIPHPFDGDLGYIPKKIRPYFDMRCIKIPDLYERRKDIFMLVEWFLASENEMDFSKIPPFDIEVDFIENTHRLFDNLSGLREIVKRFYSISPSGGTITSRLANEYLEIRMRDQPFDEQLRFRCEKITFNKRYQGSYLSGEKVFTWVKQFEMFFGKFSYNPIDIGEKLVTNIIEDYFYQEDRIIDLLNIAHKNLISLISNEVKGDPKYRNFKNTILNRLIITNPLGLLKSPDAIGLKYRKVSRLSPKNNTCEYSQIPSWFRIQTDTARVLVIDDFIGRGHQLEKIALSFINNKGLCESYKSNPSKPTLNIYFIYCVAFLEGVNHAREVFKNSPKWLKFNLVYGILLDEKDKAFNSRSRIFPDEGVRKEAEKIVIDCIGKKIQPQAPRGYGDMESLVVFEHNTPNDSLPIIHENSDKFVWYALFPRMNTTSR